MHPDDRTTTTPRPAARGALLATPLVAVLVAATKLGDLVEVTPGLGVVAFGAVVVLSMLASMSFDPRAIWEDRA